MSWFSTCGDLENGKYKFTHRAFAGRIGVQPQLFCSVWQKSNVDFLNIFSYLAALYLVLRLGALFSLCSFNIIFSGFSRTQSGTYEVKGKPRQLTTMFFECQCPWQVCLLLFTFHSLLNICCTQQQEQREEYILHFLGSGNLRYFSKIQIIKMIVCFPRVSDRTSSNGVIFSPSLHSH